MGLELGLGLMLTVSISCTILPAAELPCGQTPAHGPQSGSVFLMSKGVSKSDNLNVERG